MMPPFELPPSYYASIARPAPQRPELEAEVEADVCVLGGGYTGLQAALELAERGFRVVLLEARCVGWGASGRNGGQICSGFSAPMPRIERWAGVSRAAELFALAEEAKSIIRERVAQHRIDCGLKWGYFHAADRPREMLDAEAWAAHWQSRYGYRALEVVRGREAVRALLDSPRYIGGLFDAGAGHLNPLNYCLGLARAAEAAGVKIHEASAVLGIERGPKLTARTARGAVRANFLVAGGNAYLGALLPEAARTIMPVGTYIAATEPLGEERARRLIPSDCAVGDLKFVLDYFRLSEDRRLLFGGLVSYTTLEPFALRRAMRRRMLRVFPQLEGIALDHVWGGFVAITMERTPHLGRLGENIYFAHGYSGSGVTLAGIAARTIAEAIAGAPRRFELLASLPHTAFPGGRLLRAPTLAAAMLWYRLRDLRP